MFSAGIIAENFEVFENYIFDCKVLWMIAEAVWNSVGFLVLRRLKCGFSVYLFGRLVCLWLQQSQGSRFF